MPSTSDSITAASPVPPPSRSTRNAESGLRRERDQAASDLDTPVGAGSHHYTSSNASPAAPESKKRKAAPGSRGVANLTPEQLAKKRANGMFMTLLRFLLLP